MERMDAEKENLSSGKPTQKEKSDGEGISEDSIHESHDVGPRCHEGAVRNEPAAPLELRDLELYRTDPRLLKQWNVLFPSWKQAFPGLDVLSEVRKAHSWEVSNPQRRKKDRPRFLWNWLARQSDRPRVPWARGGLEISPGAQIEATERETLIGAILEVKGTVPLEGHSYEIRAEGLQLNTGTATRILPWMKLTTPDLRTILDRAKFYREVREVF